jgi:hypothetical protein
MTCDNVAEGRFEKDMGGAIICSFAAIEIKNVYAGRYIHTYIY